MQSTRFARGLTVSASVLLLALGQLVSATPSSASSLDCPPPRSPYDVSFACAQEMSRAATEALLQANARQRGEALLTPEEGTQS
jgi:hypothetical protein